MKIIHQSHRRTLVHLSESKKGGRPTNPASSTNIAPGNRSQVVSKEGTGEGKNEVMARIAKAKGETTDTEKVGKRLMRGG